jgi:hypothetical protein
VIVRFIMAGVVRQPIDQAALERYIDQHAPEIKTPLELKQVRVVERNLELHTNDSVVWLWSIESHLPPHS